MLREKKILVLNQAFFKPFKNKQLTVNTYKKLNIKKIEKKKV